HAVSLRMNSCQDGGVRRKRQRHLGDGIQEHSRVGRPCERVEVWCQAARRSVRADAIESQRVDRDEYDWSVVAETVEAFMNPSTTAGGCDQQRDDQKRTAAHGGQ